MINSEEENRPYYDEEIFESNTSLLKSYLDSLDKKELISHKVPITNFTNYLCAIGMPIAALNINNGAVKYIFNSFFRISPNVRMTQFFKYKTYLKHFISYCNGEENSEIVRHIEFPDNFFYMNEDELIEDIEMQIEAWGEEPYDKYDTFKCIAILLWLGCSLDEIESVQLSDVTANEIHIPLNDKKIVLSNLPTISNELLKYKNSDGCHTYKKDNLAFESYKTDFFIRTTREAKDHKTTVFNMCRYFNQLRISKTKIIESGFVWRLYQYEIVSGQKPLFNDSAWLKQYGYMNRTSAKYAYDLFLEKLNKQ